MKRRILSMVLALVMVLGLCPQGFAVGETDAITVTDPGDFETTTGAQEKIYLDSIFTDSEGHELTYTLSEGDYGTQTKIAQDKEQDNRWMLSFTNPNEGTYTPTVTATCSGGATASVTLKIVVKKGDGGTENQYGYDETDAASVKVYVTVSSDGIPIRGNEGTVLSHLEVDVPYFDLENQDLSDYYRYGTENGRGSYVNDKLIRRPTALHLYLYLLGVYYLGLTPEQVTTGAVKILGHEGGFGVQTMLGQTAYEDKSLALNITGSPTSLYMQQFWGHDENLMYYRNHVYPLMGPGWGSTADYILLSDGDTIDLAMFSNWNFWQSGAFATFDQDEWTVTAGDSIHFHTVKYDTKSVAQGGSEQFDPIAGLTVKVYDEKWNEVADALTSSGKDNNEYSYTFSKAGTYYLMAVDPNCGTSDSCYAPATAKVTVKEAGASFDPDTYYKDYDFSRITLDETGTNYLYNIAESTVNVKHFQNPGEKKLYTVTVPKGTDVVYATYPADMASGILEYCALFTDDGEIDWTYYAGSDYEYTVTKNNDGTCTVKIPAGFLMEKGLNLAAESGTGYEYFNCFKFVEGDNNLPGGDVAVTGVTLDQTELTLAAKDTARLTATVLPDNANKRTVTWSSNQEDVAKVDNTGLVTAVSEGTAVITVTTDDGGFQASCTVKVTEPVQPEQDEDGWYLIRTASQLKWFADQVNGGSTTMNGRLEKDVDLSGICSPVLGSWTSIGDMAYRKDFQGSFDGQNHKVTGLYVKREGSPASGETYDGGLFGECDGATIKNLSVYGEAWAVTRYVGGIVGRMTNLSKNPNGSLIENCHNYVEIKGEMSSDTIYGHAGVVASAQDTVIRNCSNNAAITGVKGSVGGILGNVSYGTVTIENCWNTGDITMVGYYSTYGGVGGILGTVDDASVRIVNCRNTGAVTAQSTKATAAKAGGIAGYVANKKGSLQIENCYSIGAVSGNISRAGRTNGVLGGKYSLATVATASNCYYLDSSATDGGATGVTAKTEAEMHSLRFAAALGDGYQVSCPYPVLTVEEAAAHTFENGTCTVCGAVTVPTRKADYPAVTTATVQTGKAYLLSDLQAGKVFEPVSGQSLSYRNYYYERSADEGATWDAMTGFSEAVFGATTIQVTETKEGHYLYRFYASHDGVNFSADTWTLDLTVEDHPEMNFSFYVGKDYTGGYPVIKLYNVTTDEEGNETLGEEITDCFRYSDFTTTLPEGQEEYNPAEGILVKNYRMFYVTLRGGRYAYRAFAKNADTGAYDIALGGMTLDLPTDTNVDGLAGGGTNIYLQCNSYYVSSKKTDNTYFTADEYHVKVDCPIMKTSCVMGDPYIKGNYTYYPTMLYAAGNACLYNVYAYPDIDGYIFTQAINQTYRAGYSAGTKSLTINTAIELTVTVPADSVFGLYFQWNNFNTTEIAPLFGDEEAPIADRWKINDDGTKTATYEISKGNGNYTWRLTDSTGTYVTKTGWLSSQSANASMHFEFAESDRTDKVSHDRSGLGTQVVNRDEADLQINLDPSGYKAITETTRVRAYRHWQLINSDAGNIMVEPDFHWNLLSGDASFETVNGGNTSANWADVTPGTQDSILAVYYDSVDVTTASLSSGEMKFATGSHGGFFPATNPSRVGVIVVGGTDVTHGTADADVDYNMAAGATTSRSADWDYNYDTWFYNADETDPALDFAVNATGNVTVEYAFVTATEDLTASVSAFTAVTAANGRYTVPLKALKDLGGGKGGTVIIRMTDTTGVSYRLVRVAEVTTSYVNVSNPGEPIMPGDQVKVSFEGMFRAVNKISGVFNPTVFKPTYYIGENKFEGTLGQYQRMDNASVTVTIPADLTVPEGKTATCTLTNGYTYGSMYSAANPFAFLYNMTDTGVGTNFNAVTVNYYMNRYADVTVEVSPKVTYNVKLSTKDADGAAVTGVTAVVKDKNGVEIGANSNGTFTLGYGTYTYELSKSGYVTVRSSFTLGSADAEKVVGGILTVETVAMPKTGENAWDGETLTQPATDENGTYLIGTGAELAWFAQTVNGGQKAINGKLTADIELSGNVWSPIGVSGKQYAGTFDGDGHTVVNLYINSSSYPLGLFAYLAGGSTVKNLGVSGSVTCTAKRSAQAGGIAGYMNSGSTISNCFSTVDITSAKHAGGIAGYTANGAAIIDCYATGKITTTSANECYLGGICGSGYSNTVGATLTNCYSTATVTGSGGTASYIGALSPDKTSAHYVNSYYLADVCSGESGKYGITGLGTAKTSDELKALAPTLGDAFTADSTNINGGYPVLTWQVPQPVTGTFSFTAQASGAFLCAPQNNVEVSSDLAESYGFDDKVAYTDAVSPLDVLVKAHEVIFGEAFTKETASEYLAVSSSGTSSKLFGVATYANGFFVNNAYPNDGTASAYGGYNGYLLNNMPLMDGDLVEFFLYQDASTYTDSYAWMTQDGTYTRTLTAQAGRNVTVQVQAVMAMMGYMYKDEAAMVAAGTGVAGAQLALVNAETGELTDITGAVTDEKGNVTFKLPTEGTYLLTAYMPQAEIDDGSNPLILTLSTVTVTAPTIILGDVNGDGEVTPLDATLAYAIANGEIEATAEQLKAADVNGDGEITPFDATLIYAYSNGELNKFPAEG